MFIDNRWTGNSHAWFGGRVMLGTHYACFFANIGMIVAAVLVFEIGVAWRLSGFAFWLGWVIAAPPLYYLVRAATTDPGIIPRTPVGEAPIQPPDYEVNAEGPNYKLCGKLLIYFPLRLC
jgi:hypothetical protein